MLGRLRTRRLAAVTAAALSVVLTLGSAAEAAKVLTEDWLIIRISGQSAGNVHIKAVEENGLIKSRLHQIMDMKRMGVSIRQEVLLESTEKTDGTPISFKQVQKVAAQTVTIEGRIADGTLALTSTTMGQERTRSVEWPDDTRFGYALELHIRKNAVKPNSSFSYKTFSVELDKFVDVTHTVGSLREIDVLGKRVKAYRAKVEGLYPGITPIEYRDARGVTWKLELGMMGLQMEMLRSTKEGAKSESMRPANFDALTDLSVVPDKRFSRPREVRSATYRLSLKHSKMSTLTLDGPGQEVVSNPDDKTAVIKVTSVIPSRDEIVPHPVRKEGFDNYLAASTFVQSDDPTLIATARKAIGNARSAYAAAKRLETWVHKNITEKNFDRGFATAREVLQDRAGDCTEHGVLLCALLRAVGIPSRVVTGLVYVNLPTRAIFGYHMWTEAYVGKWVPLDGTLAGRFMDSAHIRLSASDLSGMSPVGGMVEIFPVFGQLGISVLEYSVADASATSKRHQDRVNEFSFDVPTGWRVSQDVKLGKAEACRLIEKGGRGRITVLARAASPQTSLATVLQQLGKKNQIIDKQTFTLGGTDALRVSYVKETGENRTAIAAVKGGHIYVVRLESPTHNSRRVLDAVSKSFKFD